MKKNGIEMDLQKDLEQLLIKRMQAMNVKRDNTKNPIIDYCRLMKRTIPAQAREVRKAKDFRCPPGQEQKLSYLEHCITTGADLTPFLSKQTIDAKLEDKMLYDLNIFHFHLSDRLDARKKDGFMERSGNLLMAWVDDDTVYFIAAVSHKTASPDLWANTDYIKIIRENWPELLSDCQLEEATLSEKINTEERYKMRNVNANVLIDMDDSTVGGIYGGGQSLNGVPLDAVEEADRLRSKMHMVETIVFDFFWELLEQESELSDELKGHTSAVLELIDMEGDRYSLIEPNIKVIVEVDLCNGKVELKQKCEENVE